MGKLVRSGYARTRTFLIEADLLTMPMAMNIKGYVHEKVRRHAAGGSACKSIQETISGQTAARFSRPIRIPKCCKHTPFSPGISKMRTSFVGIASMNGLTETMGATSSATLTAASVGVVRAAGP